MASTSTSANSIPGLEDDSQYNDSIYKIHIPKGVPKVEIIFVHDIQLEGCEKPHVQTWMSRSKPPICWPKDWLSLEYPEARILSVIYDAGNWKDETTGHMKLHLLAENLRQDILSIYKSPVSWPVFMVGHGLGGLVIKALIRAISQKRHDWAMYGSAYAKRMLQSGSFLENVKGVLYYNTPCLGTRLADIRIDSPNSGSMWVNLRVLSEDTCHINEWFREWRRNNTCEAKAIFAALPINIPSWDQHVVEEASARYDVDDLYSSSTDHFNVCKPQKKTDISFRTLIELIDSKLQAISQGPVTQVHCRDESEWAKHVNDILNGLTTLGPRDGILLYRDDLEQIDKFPTLSEDLKDGLREAGFTKTDENATVESWKQV